MNYTKVLGISSLLLALAVMAGAFGAHALTNRISDYYLDVWQKAVFYHFVHALGLFMISLLIPLSILSQPAFRVVSSLMLFGIVVFSGSLYAFTPSNIAWP